jgi:hypothetical protein
MGQCQEGYLQRNDEPATRETGKHVSHLTVAFGCDEAFPEVVTPGSIKASRNLEKVCRKKIGVQYRRLRTDDQFGRKFDGYGHNYFLECVQVIRVAHALFRPGNIN